MSSSTILLHLSHCFHLFSVCCHLQPQEQYRYKCKEGRILQRAVTSACPLAMQQQAIMKSLCTLICLLPIAERLSKIGKRGRKLAKYQLISFGPVIVIGRIQNHSSTFQMEPSPIAQRRLVFSTKVSYLLYILTALAGSKQSKLKECY